MYKGTANLQLRGGDPNLFLNRREGIIWDRPHCEKILIHKAAHIEKRCTFAAFFERLQNYYNHLI